MNNYFSKTKNYSNCLRTFTELPELLENYQNYIRTTGITSELPELLHDFNEYSELLENYQNYSE
jgi:hypothetical protein